MQQQGVVCTCVCLCVSDASDEEGGKKAIKELFRSVFVRTSCLTTPKVYVATGAVKEGREREKKTMSNTHQRAPTVHHEGAN